MTASAPEPAAPVEPQVPPEAKQAAVAELERLEQAETYQPRPSAPIDPRGYIVPDAPPRRGYSMPGGHDDGPMAPPPGRPQALEDLYAMYPKIGDGQFKVRVARIFPKNYRGVLTEGFLEDLDEKLPLAEFQDRFGGGVYKVSVIGPGRKVDESGTPLIQTLGAALDNLKIPGPPALTSLPKPKEEEMYSMMGMGNRVMPFGMQHEPETVQLEKLRQQEREQKRRDEQQLQLLQMGSRGEPAVTQMATAQATEMRMMYSAHAKTLEEQNNKLIESMQAKEKENGELRSQLTVANSEAARTKFLEKELDNLRTRTEVEANAERTKHTAEVDNLRTRHESAMKEINDRHASELARLHEENRNATTRTNEEHRNEMARETQRHTEERQKLSEANTEKLLMYKEDAQRRVDDMVRQHDREHKTLTEVHQRELNGMNAAIDTRTEVSKVTTEARVESLKDQLEYAKSSYETLKAETELLRSKLNKSPRELLMETKEMATDLLGMTIAQPEEKDAPFDLKKEIAGGLRSLIDKAPEAMRELGNMRNQAQQQVQEQQQQMLQQQQQMVAQQQAQRGLPPAQRRAARQAWSPAAGPPPGYAQPMASGASPYPAHMGPVMGVPAPPPPLSFQYAVPAPEQADGAAARAAAQPMPVSMQPQPQPPPPPQAQQPPPPVQQQHAAQQQPPPQGAPLQITNEQIIMFLDELSKAVPPNGVVPAGAFARGFVERVGPDITRALLENIQPEQIFGEIEQRDHKPWRVIVTRDGQRYTREVWAAAASEVR